MELDPVAAEIVLRSIREAVPSRWTAKVEELRLHRTRAMPSVRLAEYLEETGLDLDDVYTAARSWSDLRSDAGLAGRPRRARTRTSLRRACGRLLHVDDAERIEAYRRLLAPDDAPRPRVASGARPAAAADARRIGRRQGGDQGDEPRGRLRPAVGAPAGARRARPSCSTCSRSRLDHFTPALATAPGRAAAGPRALHAASRSSAAFGVGDGRQGRAVADRRVLGQGRRGRPVRLHARQDQRPVLAHHPLPRLRDQPRADPLGEPVDDARRQRDRPPLPAHASAAQSSCSSPASAATTAPSGSSGPPTTSATSPSCRWRSPGGCITALPGDLFAAFAAAVA